MALRVKI